MNGAAALSDECGLFFFPSHLMFDLILQCVMGFFYNSGIYVLRYSLLGHIRQNVFILIINIWKLQHKIKQNLPVFFFIGDVSTIHLIYMYLYSIYKTKLHNH